MKFFVPGEEDADAAWERMRKSCGAQEGTTRPIYSITSDHGGTEITATVGEEGVIAIIAGQPFHILEAGSRRPVPWQSVTELVFFDDDWFHLTSGTKEVQR